jgi:hypothetical protein
MLRRVVIAVFAFVIASGVGAIFLGVSALFDPATRELGVASVLAGLFALMDEAASAGDPGNAIAALGHVIWIVVVATCAAPLAVAVLIGEAAGARSLVWFSGVSGVLAGASPWIARAAKGLERTREMNDAEGRLALLFFLTGALTGAIYWLIAVPPPRDESAPKPSAAPAARQIGKS